MEKQKKKMIESIPKSIIYTFLMYFLAIAEVGILSGFRYVNIDPDGRNGTEIGLAGSTKGYELDAVLSEVGLQFVIVSIGLFIAALAWCFYFGFKRNPYGMVTVAVMSLLPVLGLLNTSEPNTAFSFLWGYGTSGYLPFMALFGMHQLPLPVEYVSSVGVGPSQYSVYSEAAGRMVYSGPFLYTAPLVFMLIFTVLTVVAWVLGRMYRKSYAEKYEFDLSVPLI